MSDVISHLLVGLTALIMAGLFYGLIETVTR